ncbi:MAG: beta-L-arabinofuranosidase domain-containing protein [Clostridium fessum]
MPDIWRRQASRTIRRRERAKLLDICCKLCDHIDRRFGREAGKAAGIPGHEEIELALMRLYQATGEERYRKLAAYFIDERGRDPEFFHKEAAARSWSRTDYMDKQPPSYMQNHKPVREAGYGGRTRGPLYVSSDGGGKPDRAQNHDEALMAACRKMWDNMVDRRMYITGGIGSTYYGEAFTVDYDLPNDTAYAETCAAVGVCFFTKQMLEADPDARYADILEREIYNGTISGMQLDGTKFFYINQLEANPGMPTNAYGEEEYTPERIGWYDWCMLSSEPGASDDLTWFLCMVFK